MKKTCIGILTASDIAKRRFIPALLKYDDFEFAGIGFATDEERNLIVHSDSKVTADKKQRAEELCTQYGVKLYESFMSIIGAPEIDAIYISLPPALHYHWCMEALKAGKHILVEKPLATSIEECEYIIKLAGKKRLVVAENYGFIYHNQMRVINELISSREIGELRLLRAAFGFPRRSEDDFRYVKKLGGGALLDCGGYTIRLAGELLGESMRLTDAILFPLEGHDVDGHGYVSAVNDHGLAAQLSFGMDNQYKCELEIWGEKGIIYTDRIFTAPPEYEPKIRVMQGMETRMIEAGADDQFLGMIRAFDSGIKDERIRIDMYDRISDQNRRLMKAFELNA